MLPTPVHDAAAAAVLSAALHDDNDRLLRAAAACAWDRPLLAGVLYRLSTLVRPCGQDMTTGQAIDVMDTATVSIADRLVGYPDGTPLRGAARFAVQSLSWAVLERYEPTAAGKLIGASAEAPDGHVHALLTGSGRALAALIGANDRVEADEVLDSLGGDNDLWTAGGDDADDLLAAAVEGHLAGVTSDELSRLLAERAAQHGEQDGDGAGGQDEVPGETRIGDASATDDAGEPAIFEEDA